MTPTEPEEPRIEHPRGEIEIIGPGQQARGRDPWSDGAGAAPSGRTFVFTSRSGGVVSTVLVALGVIALFGLLLGTFAVVAGVAVAIFAGLALRNGIRRWLGR